MVIVLPYTASCVFISFRKDHFYVNTFYGFIFLKLIFIFCLYMLKMN